MSSWAALGRTMLRVVIFPPCSVRKYLKKKSGELGVDLSEKIMDKHAASPGKIHEDEKGTTA